MVPTNKNGTKKAEVARIEEQAEECRRMLYEPTHHNYLGIEVLETQHRIVNEDHDAVVIDVVGRRLSDNVIGHIDLKLTADINNTYSEHGWGNVYGRDYIQQIYYQHVFEKEYGKPLGFNCLLVFDYTPSKGKKLVTITPTESGFQRMLDRFSSYQDVINHYEQEGWPYLPSIKECENCPLQCSSRMTEAPLIVENVTV
jgi:hypothetical protein